MLNKKKNYFIHQELDREKWMLHTKTELDGGEAFLTSDEKKCGEVNNYNYVYQ